MLPFIFISRGLSEFIDGLMFTYISQGLRLESMSTSNPRT